MEFNVYLGTPVGGGVVSHEYLHAVLALHDHFQQQGWGLKVVTQPDALVTRSRNAFGSVVVRDATFTHLLMLDADVVISPEAITRMLRSGHDVVGAGVPLRQVAWDKVRAFLDLVPDADPAEMQAVSHRFATHFEPAGGARIPVNGFLAALVIGSAAMLISRSALVSLAESDQVATFSYAGHGSDGQESGWTFFDPLVAEDGSYLSEDYAFCQRWRNAGGKVWVDLESTACHVGPVPIHGDIATTLRAGTKASAARRRQS